MTLEEYRKEKGLSYYNFGLELGITWCAKSRHVSSDVGV